MAQTNDSHEELGLSLDNLQDCSCPYSIWQDKKMFCYGIDAVLLAAFTKTRGREKICDLCSGNGIIPLLLASRSDMLRIDCVEIQARGCDLIRKSIDYNGLEGRLTVHNMDLNSSMEFLEKNTYDIVTCNPPYQKIPQGNKSPDGKSKPTEKEIARHEIFCTLEDVIRTASGLLKSNGKFYMIHRPERIAEILVLFERYNLGARRIRPVQSRMESDPVMILVEGEKCSRALVKMEFPIAIYEEGNNYSSQTRKLYSLSGSQDSKENCLITSVSG